MAKHETLRKRKQRLAGSNTTKGRPGVGYVSGCPDCNWVNSALRKQNEPVHVAVQGDRRFAKCVNGHRWKLSSKGSIE